MTYIKFIAVLVPLMATIDALWIGGIMKGFYKTNLGYIMGDSFKLLPAILFYLLYILALVYFVLLPGFLSNLSYQELFIRGAFFGLVAYGTYDLTNHATLKDWPYIVTIIDMAWGGFITGVVSIVGKYVSKFFL